MSQLGILQPNPALFEIENLRKKSHLAHELGQGSKCIRCGDKCPGFQLHYWRKVCTNCRCGKAEHNVIGDEDPGFYFVGKIFDRPLRSKKEELEFCFGDEDTSSSSSSSDDDDDKKGIMKKHYVKNSRETFAKKKVTFEWVPPNTSKSLARKYLKKLPEDNLPIVGTQGAIQRKKQLEKQFPKHDIEPKECHELTPVEVETMTNYISNVKKNVVGQGVVTQVSVFHTWIGHSPLEDQHQEFPPPPSDDLLNRLGEDFKHSARINDEDIPPPPLPDKPKSYIPGPSRLGSGTYYAKPAVPLPGSLSGKNNSIGSTASSVNSSRENTPSPNHDGNNMIVANIEKPSIKSSHAFLAPQSHEMGKKKAAHSDPKKNRQSKIKCTECKLTLNDGDVAVKADRAGHDNIWHPQCFKCFTCQEILVDLLYYYDSGRLFCARDYAAQVNIPRCSACDELIFAIEYTGAENKAWHIKHFCCYECDRPLAGHKYIPIDSQPHCLYCYQKKHGKLCKNCGEYINPEDQRVSLGKEHWHATSRCFSCAVCQTSLLGRKMTRKYDLILCSSDCVKKANQFGGNPRKESNISTHSSLRSGLSGHTLV